MGKMEFRSLRYFVQIAELGSITAAAQRLRVAQPSLTRHMKNLEKDLGVALFVLLLVLLVHFVTSTDIAR